MSSFLQSIDQFGIEEKVLFQRSITSKKSVFGGIMTLFIYGVTLAYFLYQFIDWIDNNKLPKVTSTSKQINHSETVGAKGKFLEISYFSQSDKQIDPFNPTSLIYYPKLTLNPSQTEIYDIQFEQEISEDGKTINKFVLYDIELMGSPPQYLKLNQKDYQISFKRCNPEILKEGMQCANEATFNQYKEQLSLFQIQIYIEQFNIKTKQLDKIPKFYILNMLTNKIIFYTFQLECSLISIDDGYLFPNSIFQKFFHNMYQLIQEYDEDYAKKYFDKDLVMVVFLTLDQIKKESLYEYPKISEILAETGSIISWVFTISYLVTWYNQELSMQNINSEVILMYFNDFKNLTISKNWYGKITNLSFKEKSCEKLKMIKLLNKLQELAKQKLDFKTILLELSRIERVLVLLLGQEKIKQLLNRPQKLETIIDKYSIIEHKDASDISNQIYPQGELSNVNLKPAEILDNEGLLNIELSLEQELEQQLCFFSSIDTLNNQIQDKTQFVNIKDNFKLKKIDSNIFQKGNSPLYQQAP
ncbi:unnamed protein product [Paramecium sonneborni]|uniref:Transmembrane protein n=1 Tax=Paramecium sonneborni TaxID=65129 RepID=A0A8S1Q4H8_9CILI|nr:unnamed protein product [Paramecium sonneborni]